MNRVLFVCLGNICRSPMAEGIVRQEVEKNTLAIEVDSAATSNWEKGNPPHNGTQAILKNRGISYDRMYSRQIELHDFEQFDYIIGMDKQNVHDLMEKCPVNYQSKIHLFMEVVEGMETMDVPDPWYTGDFDETERLIDQAVLLWIKKISQPI